MIENMLQLNDEKTECLLILPSKCTQYLNCTSLSFGNNFISFSTTAKNHGFHLTDDMRIDAYVQDIRRKAYIDLRRISSIRHILSTDATKTLLSAFVLPKLDYCNSRFYDSPVYMLERPQKVQYSAAGQTFQCRNQYHISPLLMSLHWLPIKSRIEYKLSYLSLFLFRFVSYLLSVYIPKRKLRSSSDNGILCILKQRTKTFGHRSFSFAVLAIWNSLPSELRHTDSIMKFMSGKKTHLS